MTTIGTMRTTDGTRGAVRVEDVFTSTWTGPSRIEVCDAPHRLLLTMAPETEDETKIEAWLTAEGPQTRLVVEEAWPAGRPAPLPRSGLAGPPRGPRTVAGQWALRLRQRLVGAVRRVGLARALD